MKSEKLIGIEQLLDKAHKKSKRLAAAVRKDEMTEAVALVDLLIELDSLVANLFLVHGIHLRP